MSLQMAPMGSSVQVEHLLILAAIVVTIFVFLIYFLSTLKLKSISRICDTLDSYGTFFFVSFVKPHTGDNGAGQQGALESFYQAQVRGRTV